MLNFCWGGGLSLVELAGVRVIWQLCVLLNNFNRNILLSNFLMVYAVSDQFFVYIICCVTMLGWKWIDE